MMKYDSAVGLLKGQAEKSVNSNEEIHSIAVAFSHTRSRTPPMDIAVKPGSAPRRNRDPAPCPEIEPIRKGAGLVERAARKKRRQRRDIKEADLAVNIVRGFQTPVTSAGEESDYATGDAANPKLSRTSFSSATSSPGIRPSPSRGGISALRLQLDALNLSADSRSSSLGRTTSVLPGDYSSNEGDVSGYASDVSQPKLIRHEVPLEHDFTSPDADSLPNLGTGEPFNINRKMTAIDFEQLRCLGKGAFGTVVLVKQRATGKLYAQKQLRKASIITQKVLIDQANTERAILESVNSHPFVVKLYYAFQDHAKLYLILEYAQGGELFSHLAMEGLFDADKAAFYMAEMVMALEHLHRNLGVVYRDLKPENCLLDAEGHLLLTDFGLSKVALDEDDVCRSILGTVDYMAPEVISGSAYSFAVDWWSLGALGFDLLSGAPPFQANNHAKVQEKILKAKPTFPYFLGPDSKDLLTRLLRKDPRKRLGGNMPGDMQVIRKHRFFRKIEWARLERREVEPPIRPVVGDPERAECFAREFTEMELGASPVDVKRAFGRDEGAAAEMDPFAGFSFVASQSLLMGGMEVLGEDY